MQLTTYKTAASTDRAAVLRYLKALAELGWRAIRVNDGEEDHIIDSAYTHEGIADELMAVEEAWLYVRKGTGSVIFNGTMYFVFGNDPWEVMADCSMGEVFDGDMKLIDEAINLEGVN